jgi:dTMP kinase
VFIVIDGLDASGKSTQGLGLRTQMRKHGKSICLRIHPSEDNFFGTSAKKFLYLEGKGAHFASALFYMLDVLRSILLYSWRKYDYIVFVRYLMGTAYLPSPLHRIAYQFFVLIVPKSNYMFFLDVDPEEAYKRIKLTRNITEMFETREKLRLVRSKALSLISTGGWRILDANKPAKLIENDILTPLGLSVQ